MCSEWTRLLFLFCIPYGRSEPELETLHQKVIKLRLQLHRFECNYVTDTGTCFQAYLIMVTVTQKVYQVSLQLRY